MRKLWSAGLGLMLLAGSVGAQITTDAATRTVSVDLTRTAADAQYFNQAFYGTINTDGLASYFGANPANLMFQIVLGGPGGGSTPILVTATGGIVNDPEGSQYGFAALFGASFGAGENGVGMLQQDYTTGVAESRYMAGGPTAGGGIDPTPFPPGRIVSVIPGTVIPYDLNVAGTTWLAPFGPGATAHFQGSITLAGISAYDAGWHNVVATASFDDQGNAYFLTTPEPSSLAMLGTGLFALAPFARRRRVRSSH